MGTTQYTCDCSSTHYKGHNCKIGIISFPSIPILTVNQTSAALHISAYPEESIVISFSAPAPLDINPSNVTIVSGYPNAAFVITAKQSGTFQITYTISGSNAAEFEEPETYYVLVLGSFSTHTPNNYFSQLGLDLGLLASGCCTPGNVIYQCPFGISTLSFSSTCMWSSEESNIHLTDGIVFSSGSGVNLPVSIIGTELFVSSNRVQNSLPSGHFSCTNCSSTGQSCYHYDFTSSDIIDLLRSQALGKTYLNHSHNLLPTWLNFDLGNATLPLDTAFSSFDYSTALSIGDEVRFIQGCEGLQVDQNGLYSILRYHNNLTVLLSSSFRGDYNPTTSDAPVCFAVNLCSGSSSPVHITIPASSKKTLFSFDQIQKYIDKGWEFTFTEALVSYMGVSPPIPVPTQYWNGTRKVSVSVPDFDLRLKTTLRNTLTSNELWINLDFSGDLFHQANTTGPQVNLAILYHTCIIVMCIFHKYNNILSVFRWREFYKVL